MKNCFRNVLLLVFAAVCASQAGAQPSASAVLIPCTDYSVYDRWVYTVPESGPFFPLENKVVRGQWFNIILVVLDYGVKDNRALVTYDLAVTRPDNTVYMSRAGLVAFDIPVLQRLIKVAGQGVKISFDPPDKSGTYTITAMVHDKISG